MVIHIFSLFARIYARIIDFGVVRTALYKIYEAQELHRNTARRQNRPVRSAKNRRSVNGRYNNHSVDTRAVPVVRPPAQHIYAAYARYNGVVRAARLP